MTFEGLFDLSGKTALVTGGRQGIGFGIASVLAEYGADIISVSSKQTQDDELSRIVKGYGRKFQGIACDFTKREETLALVEKLKGERIDILVNNAGQANRGIVLEHTDDIWDKTIEVDLNAPFILSRELAKGMVERGYGKIIFIGSLWTFLGGRNVVSYTASKTALGGVARAMSNELSSSGININVISPGFFDTEINERLKKDLPRYEALTSRIPLGRWGVPNDIAGTALFLASPASDYVCGVVIAVDGGFLAN
ncbi:MAG: SDR family oxidoreductase [Actinobacteria bacterium]|nr:SDR family oxidoreductase [Actinomycetota bacterium]